MSIPAIWHMEYTEPNMGFFSEHYIQISRKAEMRRKLRNYVTPATTQREWRDEAECANYPADWWFAPTHTKHGRQQAEQAIAICNTCPVQTQCRDEADTNNLQYGIWGGTNNGLTPDD
jgi:WhiB family redox-sensing transcriptional regulator